MQHFAFITDEDLVHFVPPPREKKMRATKATKIKYGRKKKAISGNDDEETTTTRCKVPRLDISVIIIKISGSLHISKFDYFTERFELLRQH